ncbi:hypothetical protein ACGRHY_11035 [Streptomyces sp. HK10]|uniref:hypothetical protein n=1 Tax=Streptomyces sp. HK10 TaxID=3373255 RepID=UPI0037496861
MPHSECEAVEHRDLPAGAMRSFGCAPSHRWAFELEDTPRCRGEAGGLTAEVDLLLHV